MKYNSPIYFDKRHFFDEQEFKNYIERTFSANNSASRLNSLRRDLFDLYCLGKLERFGLQSIETEAENGLQAIKEHFKLSAELAITIDIKKYCVVNEIDIECAYESKKSIEIIEIAQRKSIQTFNVSPFCLNIGAIQYGYITFTVNYSIHDTIPQKLVPALEFYSQDGLNNKYASISDANIDLSNKGAKSISFNVRANDIFTQGAGKYIIKFGSSDIAIVEFPRCGLSIASGVYSLDELRNFCNNLKGSPSKDLSSFYDLLSSRTLESWLRDEQENKEEGKIRNKISKCIDDIIEERRRFKINDINSILKIISNRKEDIAFPMSEYFSAIISKIASRDIIGKQKLNDKTYYFIPWNSTTSGKLTTIIQPTKECIGLDIDFTFKIRAKSMSLIDNVVSVNLRDIEQREERELDFKISVPQSQNMGEYEIDILDKQGFTQTTDVCLIVTGEKIPIPLSQDSSITMVGIYSLNTRPFYLAQTTLTQKQVSALVKQAEKNGKRYNRLLETYNNALTNNGSNDYLPCSYMNYKVGQEIRDIFNSFVKDYKFEDPEVENLEIALFDGLKKHVPYKHNRTIENLQPISFSNPIHSTRLGVLDLLGNILSVTYSFASTKSFKYLYFGTTYRDPHQENLRIKESDVDSSLVGYRPMMVKNISKNNVIEESSNSTKSSSYDGDIVQPIDFAVFL